MKYKIILIIINIIGYLIQYYVLMPQCPPCYADMHCYMCLGSAQAFFIAIGIIFNIYYWVKYIEK